MRQSIKQAHCDGPNCDQKVMVPMWSEDAYIPDNWLRTLMTSNEYVWETKYYDLCSVACLERLKSEISELVAIYNGETDSWATDDLAWSHDDA